MCKHYKHILVPLDSSELAELALNDALGMAEVSGASITLLHVISPIEQITTPNTKYPVFIDQYWENCKMIAQSYLNDVCQRLSFSEKDFQTVIQVGLAAEVIIQYAQQCGVDLIVMAPQGCSGIKPGVYGSVANKVLQQVGLRVLLVHTHQQLAEYY